MDRARNIVVTNKVVKPGTLDAAPSLVRVSVMDPYATESSDEEYENGYECTRVKRIINEIRIMDPSIDIVNKRASLKQRSKQKQQSRRGKGVGTKIVDGGSYAGKKLRGVRQRKWGRWSAEIRDPVKRSRVWLGTFDTAQEAAIVYDREAIRLRGPNAQTNFLKPPEEMQSTLTIEQGSDMDMDMEAEVAVLVDDCEASEIRNEWIDDDVVNCGYNSGMESNELPSPSCSPTSVLVFKSSEPDVVEEISAEYTHQDSSYIYCSGLSVDCSDFEIPPPMFIDESCVPLFVPSDKLCGGDCCIREDFESCNLDLDNCFCNDTPN